MTESERNAKMARLEQRWAGVPKAMKERLFTSVAAQIGRIIEGDRPFREYIAKARQRGMVDAVDAAEAIRESSLYDGSAPDRMQRLAGALADIPKLPHRPPRWHEDHFARMDSLVAEGCSPTGAAKAILKEDGIQLADPKGTADSLVKAWKKDRRRAERQK